MDIEHCDRLSWFSRRGESHGQDGETLPAAAMPQTQTASGDPAMAFEPSIEPTGDHSARLAKSAAASLPDEHRISPVSASKRASTPRIDFQRRIPSRSINDL
jgi:hypothetical protein